MKIMRLLLRAISRVSFSAVVLTAVTSSFGASLPPEVGAQAPNFTLNTLDERPIELKVLTAKRPVVLLMLRGWPGYQCPICTRQVNDFVSHAAEFAKHDVQVLMVYPGPAEALKAHAQEFLADKQWPVEFLFVVDPDYAFTHAYGLRWDAPKETAYPSNFIIDQEGRVRFAHISRTHGDRVSARAALDALVEIQRQ
jgi:peroxiredoxin